MFVDDFAKQLTVELGWSSPLVADEEGIFYLGMSQHVRIAMSPHAAGIMIWANVGEVPPEDSGKREGFFRTLLLANLLGQGTGRSSLGLDERGEKVRLVFAVPYEIPYLECRDGLEEFLNFAEYWYGQIKGHNCD